jgi:hypothetical protein
MERDPIQYSRLLVFVGLVPLLFADVVVGLPGRVFAVGGTGILVAAGIVHLYGGERSAGAGWLVFGVALALIGTLDVTANRSSLAAFAALLLLGLALLVNQRVDHGPLE